MRIPPSQRVEAFIDAPYGSADIDSTCGVHGVRARDRARKNEHNRRSDIVRAHHAPSARFGAKPSLSSTKTNVASTMVRSHACGERPLAESQKMASSKSVDIFACMSRVRICALRVWHEGGRSLALLCANWL